MAAAVEIAGERSVGAVVRKAADRRPCVCGLMEIIPGFPIRGIVEPDIVRELEILALIVAARRYGGGKIRELTAVRDGVGVGAGARAPRKGGSHRAIPDVFRDGGTGLCTGLVLRLFRRRGIGGGKARIVIEFDRHKAAMGPRPVVEPCDRNAEGEPARLHHKGSAVLIESADPADVADLAQTVRIDEQRLAYYIIAGNIGYLALARAPIRVVHGGVYIGGLPRLVGQPCVEKPLTIRRVGGTAPFGGYLVILDTEHVIGVVVVIKAVYGRLARGSPYRAVKILPGFGTAARRVEKQARVGGDRCGIDVGERPADEFGYAVLGIAQGVVIGALARSIAYHGAEARNGTGLLCRIDRRE